MSLLPRNKFKSKGKKIRGQNIFANNLKWFLVGLIPALCIVVGVVTYWYLVQQEKDFQSGFDEGYKAYIKAEEFVKVPVAKRNISKGESISDLVKYVERPKNEIPSSYLKTLEKNMVARIEVPENTTIIEEIVMDRNEALYDDTRGDWVMDVKTFDVRVGDYVDLKYQNEITDEIVLPKKRVLQVQGDSLQFLLDGEDRVYYNDASKRKSERGGNLIVSLYPDPRVQKTAERTYELQYSDSFKQLDISIPEDRNVYDYVIEEARPELEEDEEPTFSEVVNDLISPIEEPESDAVEENESNE